MTVVLGVARRGILLVTLMLSGSVSTLAQVDDIDASRRMYREGILPSGEPFTAIVAGDVPVLGTLSSGNSPGVDDSAIRFATVFTQDVDVVEREAVLAVSNTFAEVINRQTRLESERWDRGYTPESRLPTVFREWIIEEWTLSGPPESWSGQLESYYQQQPIFAMLGGLGSGSWRPVSDFCEQQEIPYKPSKAPG